MIAYVGHERDGWCLYGPSRKVPCLGMLGVHHITTKGSGGSDVPENLITLCKKHHDMAHNARITKQDLYDILARLYGYLYPGQT